AGPDYLASFGDKEIIPFTVSSVTGVEQNYQEDETGEVRIYPNPTRGLFTVDLRSVKQRGDGFLRIFSADGSRISSQTISPGNPEPNVDLSSQPDGTYLIRVDLPGHSFLEKLIVQRGR